MAEPWKALVADKQARQSKTIPQDWLVPVPSSDRLNVISFPGECGLLSAAELDITETDAEVLLVKLARGEWSAVDVVTAFSKRAIVAHQVVNCLTEIFIDQALERAKNLDEHLKRTGKVVGPLHGLPISLKDQISIKGFETTMGYVSWIGKVAERDATLFEILVELGAVPYVRTNIPQTLMWPETFNNVFGRTTNPYNRSLTCGGSSGGEGALGALRGSPIGVGSDIGGSIRIPAGLNGIYGLRPCYHRIPYRGAVNSMEGQDSIPSVFGPLSPSISGIRIFMKSVLEAKPWLKDPCVLRLPWNQGEYEAARALKGGLVVGIIWGDGSIVPHPPVLRALEITKAALIAKGHKVVDWNPYKHPEIVENTRAIWRAGSNEDFHNTAAPSGEPVIHTMGLDPDGPPSSKTRTFLPPSKPLTAYQLWQLHKRKRELREEYLDHWEATKETTGTGRPVDVLISPVAPYVAPPHGMNFTAAYTTIWNGLNYPGFVIPITTVDLAVDTVKPPHEFLSEDDKDIYEMYDPETFKDAPVSVQIIGRAQQEEALIGMSEIVDEAVKAYNAGKV